MQMLQQSQQAHMAALAGYYGLSGGYGGYAAPPPPPPPPQHMAMSLPMHMPHVPHMPLPPGYSPYTAALSTPPPMRAGPAGLTSGGNFAGEVFFDEGDDVRSGGKRKRRRIVTTPPKRNLQCRFCHTTETPEWRRGPDGDHTLCNACGLHYAKTLKRERHAREGRQHSIDLLLNQQSSEPSSAGSSSVTNTTPSPANVVASAQSTGQTTTMTTSRPGVGPASSLAGFSSADSPDSSSE
jgi:hypothetical protein